MEVEPRKPFTPEELAAFLCIPEDTLAVWRSRGKGPAYFRAGKYVRYCVQAVRTWIEEQEAAEAAQASA